MKTRPERVSVIVVLLFFVMLAPAQQPGASKPSDSTKKRADKIEEMIRQMERDWMQFVNEGQIEKALQFYAKDGLSFYPGEVPLKGLDSIRESLQGLTEVQLEPYQIEHSGGLAYEVGRFSEKRKLSDGKTVETKGNYLAVGKRQPDGKWQVVAEADSPDAKP